MGKALRVRAGYMLAPSLTVVLLTLSMALVGVAPFGDMAMMAGDGDIQYVGFLGWYHRVLHGDADLLYSFSKSLGGSTFSLFAYYLASPVNLLVYFFDVPDIPTFFSLIFVVKLGIASLTCYTYLRSRFGDGDLGFVLLSVAYALAACNFTAGSNIMWLEGVIFLPLACLGVYRYVAVDSPSCLVASVALVVLLNWYSGYVVCLCLVFAFFAEALVARLSFPCLLKKGLGYLAWMVVALGLSMPVFLPVILDMLSGSGTSGSGFVETVLGGDIYPQGFLGVVESLYMGTPPASSSFSQWGIEPGNFPVSGVLLALTASLFFLPGNSSLRNRKILYGCLLLVLVASIVFKPLDMVWTGFVRSDSYNPRYAYVIVFLLTVASADFLRTSREAEACGLAKALVYAFALTLLCVLLLLLLGWSPSGGILLLQFVLVALSLFAVLVLSRIGWQFLSGDYLMLAFVLLVGVGSFAVESIFIQSRQMDSLYGNTSSSAYSAYMVEMDEAFEDLSQGEVFYRLGNMGTTSTSVVRGGQNWAPTGENMALGVPCLSHYSSTGDQAVNDFLGALGYSLTPGTRAITYYRSPQYYTDSLLGVSYVLSSEAPFGCNAERLLSLPAPYGEDYSVYRNESALSVGFTVDELGESWEWGEDPFENQQALAARLTGCGALFSDVSASSEDDRVLLTREFALSVAEAGPLYIWCGSSSTVSVYSDDVFLQTTSSWEFDTNVIYVGAYEVGDVVNVRIQAETERGMLDSWLVARTLDVDIADFSLDALRFGEMELDAFEDGYLSGSFSREDRGVLLLTIPYSDNWRVFLDGEPVRAFEWQGLMAVDVSAGDHSFRMEYGAPEGFWAGVLIAAVALFCCAGCLLRSRFGCS